MDNKMKTEGMKGMSYKKFVVMMLISFFIMYLVMFLNIDNISHYHTSTTRIYMAFLMVAPMAVVMMGMMGRMYPSRKTNIGIIVVGAIVFIVTLIALRTQTPVGDVQYMKAMIPHHSSAIMVSKHATIRDPEVKKLSELIIASQEKEITEMNQLIEKLSK
jgi:uncharacterized protein (DUF305 family)